MRARRKILLWCADLDESGRIAYLLNLQPHFTVIKAEQEVFWMPDISLAIVVGSGSIDQTMRMVHLAQSCYGTKVLVVGNFEGMDPGISSEAMVVPRNTSSADLIGHVHMLIARKRGPKPTPKPDQASEADWEVA